jgi:hypothetical protein
MTLIDDDAARFCTECGGTLDASGSPTPCHCQNEDLEYEVARDEDNEELP